MCKVQLGLDLLGICVGLFRRGQGVVVEVSISDRSWLPQLACQDFCGKDCPDELGVARLCICVRGSCTHTLPRAGEILNVCLASGTSSLVCFRPPDHDSSFLPILDLPVAPRKTNVQAEGDSTGPLCASKSKQPCFPRRTMQFQSRVQLSCLGACLFSGSHQKALALYLV